MSLTLRDAQHLCWKNYRKISEASKIDISAELLGESRKIASTIKDLEPNTQIETESRDALASGLSRLLFMAFVVAERGGIELEDAFLQEMNDYIMSHLS